MLNRKLLNETELAEVNKKRLKDIDMHNCYANYLSYQLVLALKRTLLPLKRKALTTQTTCSHALRTTKLSCGRMN